MLSRPTIFLVFRINLRRDVFAFQLIKFYNYDDARRKSLPFSKEARHLLSTRLQQKQLVHFFSKNNASQEPIWNPTKFTSYYFQQNDFGGHKQGEGYIIFTENSVHITVIVVFQVPYVLWKVWHSFLTASPTVGKFGRWKLWRGTCSFDEISRTRRKTYLNS